MYELIPLTVGALSGVTALQLTSRWLRALLVTVACLAAAFVAGTLSGELSESWAFLVWDSAQAAVAALLVLAAAPLVARARGAR